VCNGTTFYPVLKTKDFTTTQEEFQLEQCTECNFLLTNPRPDSNSIGRYYESENYISHSGKSNLFGNIYRLARKVTLNFKYRLIRRFNQMEGNVLDYGCGSGDFLYYMKSKNWKVRGIEPNDLARNKASKLLQQSVFQSVNEIIGEKYDVITLWHVLEHVHDLNETLSHLKKLLNSNGTIIIAVPNHKSADCKKYKNYWAAYDVPRHLWHFSQETMKLLMEKHKLKIIQIEPMILDAYYVSLLSEGYKNSQANKLSAGVKAFSSGLMSNFKASKTGNYSSLIYIIKAQ
jgi:2-polyprenyl-3-methyl-5-hydroxy-6-metoxy-1,4-benzoquinol methylase